MSAALPFIVAAAFVGLILLTYVSSGKAQTFDNLAGVPAIMTRVFNGGVYGFAKAIAKAEGYGLPGVIPTLANNPGDLVIPGWTGETLGEKINVLTADTPENPLPPNGGWYHLYAQLQLIADGNSKIYSPDDTLDEMAAKWTATDPHDWAMNVANFLDVDTGVRIGDLLG